MTEATPIPATPDIKNCHGIEFTLMRKKKRCRIKGFVQAEWQADGVITFGTVQFLFKANQFKSQGEQKAILAQAEAYVETASNVQFANLKTELTIRSEAGWIIMYGTVKKPSSAQPVDIVDDRTEGRGGPYRNPAAMAEFMQILTITSGAVAAQMMGPLLQTMGEQTDALFALVQQTRRETDQRHTATLERQDQMHEQNMQRMRDTREMLRLQHERALAEIDKLTEETRLGFKVAEAQRQDEMVRYRDDVALSREEAEARHKENLAQIAADFASDQFKFDEALARVQLENTRLQLELEIIRDEQGEQRQALLTLVDKLVSAVDAGSPEAGEIVAGLAQILTEIQAAGTAEVQVSDIPGRTFGQVMSYLERRKELLTERVGDPVDPILQTEIERVQTLMDLVRDLFEQKGT